jgi:sigma-B regulation protein RsbU (phosphoserine phosphatase)
MAKTASLFRCLGKGIHDPGKLLGMLNREILETSIHGMFVTMLAGVVEPRSGQVVLANAGHLPALHMGSAALIGEYSAKAPPLGITRDSVFPNETFELQGACLYLYTDGLLEAWVGEHRLESEGLVRLLKKHAHLPLAARAEAIADAVLNKETGIEDDLTLLIVEGGRRHGL